MRIKNFFTLIATDMLVECRDFYVKQFGFIPVFESTIYIQLSVTAENEGSFDLALMPSENPFGEPFGERFNGKGAYITIEVDDAEAAFSEVKASGAPIVADLRDEDWGQRHFMTKDPGGTFVDVVESIDPVAGYYDGYQIAQ